MEVVGAAFGLMAALPQCIQSAKELYDLRSRYKDASVLIAAIYSESMVIAASLSQVQNLLQHDALLSKPQLLETFDRSLTGCRVVYGCLEEEVRDLVLKAEQDDLRFKDRAKFLLKEDTFKELLTQIRGQQSALSLLIQGLQMESIADIRRLVEDNSATLDQVVKRSRTLRQMHPRLNVPDSILDHQSQVTDATDAESIIKSTEFAFDDEVVNSKAYRRAMAHYTHNRAKTPDVPEREVAEDDSTVFEPAHQGLTREQEHTFTKEPLAMTTISSDARPSSVADVVNDPRDPIAGVETHPDLFDTLERDIMSYMPRVTSTAPYLNPPSAVPASQMSHEPSTWFPAPLRSFSEGGPAPATELVPPLPPRRRSGPQSRLEQTYMNKAKERSSSDDDSIQTSKAPSILSKTSTISSYTAYESSRSSPDPILKLTRKPLPLAHKASHDILGRNHNEPLHLALPTRPSVFRNSEMHSIWSSLVDAEQKYIERMQKLRKMFYDNVIRQWPVLEKHLAAILLGEQLANLNQEYLLHVMVKQVAGNGSMTCDPSIFETWANKVQRLFCEFCQRTPHAASSLRTTQNLDQKFLPFVNTLGLSIAYFGMGWEDYLKLPNVHLQMYVDTLHSLLVIAESIDGPRASAETVRLKRALEAVTWLRALTSSQLEEAQGREDIQNIYKRIRTQDTGILLQLQLLEPGRRVRYQGGMAMKYKSQGPWTPVQVVLLDNCLLWGKAKSQKKNKGDEFVVLDDPIAVSNLEVSLPCNSHQFQKATIFDEVPRGSVLYIITMKDNHIEGKPHTLGLYDFKERELWWKQFTAATATQCVPN